jgi:hypothetical protein
MQSKFLIQLSILLTAIATNMAVKSGTHENALVGLEFGRIAALDKDIVDNEA